MHTEQKTRADLPDLPDRPMFPFPDDDRLDPHPWYERLRAEAPVFGVRTPRGGFAWLVTRYADVRAVLTDPRFNRRDTVDDAMMQATKGMGGGASSSMLYTDPPEHTAIRGLVARHFTARRVELIRPRAEQITAELLDAMLAKGSPADLLADFARPLPMKIICELLGLPVDDSERLRHNVDLLMSVRDADPVELGRAYHFLMGYLGDAVATLRARPGEDLLSALITDPAPRGREVTDEDLVGTAMLLFVTGHETTMTQITNSCLVLLQHRDSMTELIARPELLDTAVEEMLRYVPIGHAGLPFAVGEDLEFAGVRMRKGDLVLLSKLSANRDDTVFDRPDEFDIARQPNPHIGFSHGPHHCLGAALARMELRVAIGALLRGLPGLRLAVDIEELAWRAGSIQRGPVGLPIAW